MSRAKQWLIEQGLLETWLERTPPSVADILLLYPQREPSLILGAFDWPDEEIAYWEEINEQWQKYIGNNG